MGLYIPDRYPNAYCVAPRWDPTAADPPLASDSTWAAPRKPKQKARTGSLEVLETGMDHT